MPFGFKSANEKKAAEIEVAQAEAPKFEYVKWYGTPGLRALYFWCMILSLSSATTGFDGMMLNTSQNMDAWQEYFDHPKESKLGLMNAIYQIGSIAGFPPVPFLADRYGRRIPIMIGCVLMVVGAVLGAFANGYGMYVGGRFILGFGNSMAHLASPVLLTEICHPQHRARVTAIYNTLWNVGAVLVSWTAWGTIQIDNDWSWRSITLLQGVFSVIQIFFIWWVPESPRWLISKDRNEEALAMLAKYHGEGDPNNQTVQFEWQEIKETIHLELAAKKSSSYFDFFKTKGNRYRLMLLIALGIISQYSGNAIISNYSNLIYENAGIKSQNQKIPLNGGQTLLSLIVGVIAASTVDKIGRRPLFLTATAGMCLMFTAWTITSAQYEKTGNVKTTGYPQIVWIWLYSVSYAFAWSGLLVAYALEILPFKLRAKGLLIMNMTVQCVLVLGNYTNPIAWEKLPQKWNLALIYTIWIFVELAFVYFFFVETKGPTLEELAKLFDGEDAEVAHIDLNNEKEERISEHSDEKRAPNTTSTAL